MEIPPSANNQPRLTPPLQQQGGSFPEGQPRRKRKMIIAIAAGAAVVLAAAIGGLALLVLPLLSPAQDMSATAKTYFQALIDGDGEKALSVSDPGVPENEKALLRNNVYKSAGQHIDGYRILEARSDFVTAEVTQNGRKQEIILRMTKTREGAWKVGPKNFQKIRLSSSRPVNSFTVNGVDVAAPDPGTGARDSQLLMPAFPGEYTLGVSGDKYATAEEQKALISIDRAISKSSGNLKVIPSLLLLDETRTLLENKRSECTASTPGNASEASSRGCSGFALYEYRPTRNLKWTIEKEPTFTLLRGEDSWIIQPEKEGKASVSYEVNSGRDDAPQWEPKVELVAPRVSGEIHIVDGKATLEDR
ncbi:hypothetical protein [Arthrobacter sp. ISL-95]|uniref:hypothetical protein n=1 Tax=Arthrobacter sp. ISL-95 TaxID=2819116 RepID=UPI001BEBDA31|nr:hypothetical protein [Arthrobacter sp. ISL-95]MBT2584962.1 hypothetical protein [Arthrobacter sp. ISL-95]